MSAEKAAPGKDSKGEMKSSNIILSAEKGSVYGIRLALNEGVDINYQEEPSGITALHAACANCQSDAVEFILSMGGDPMIKDSFDRTAFDIINQTTRTDIFETMFAHAFPDAS